MTSNLSEYNPNDLCSADILKSQRYAIIVADWNSEITYAMCDGARETLIEHGVQPENIEIKHVPGTVELTYAAAQIVNSHVTKVKKTCNAIIAIGCVIQGDTPHFDYVCQSVTQGISILNSKGAVPVIFSVLTTLNKQQALDRAGGKLGNKGIEGAVAAMRMANI